MPRYLLLRKRRIADILSASGRSTLRFMKIILKGLFALHTQGGQDVSAPIADCLDLKALLTK